LEVKIDKKYPLEVSVEQAWVVLADINAVAGCMPGAQITEKVDEAHYKGTVKAKVGPATMSFGGDIEVQGVDAAARRIQLMAKGADKAGSSASMNLTAMVEPGASATTAVLAGLATIVVSGKLAQFGNRLLVPVSDMMLGQFADNFRAAAAAVPAPAGASPEAVAAAQAAAAAAPRAQKELNALVVLWNLIKGWLAGLFRGKKAS
jgi:carbon monoxide dehydrogenase subunit G